MWYPQFPKPVSRQLLNMDLNKVQQVFAYPTGHNYYNIINKKIQRWD